MSSEIKHNIANLPKKGSSWKDGAKCCILLSDYYQTFTGGTDARGVVATCDTVALEGVISFVFFLTLVSALSDSACKHKCSLPKQEAS